MPLLKECYQFLLNINSHICKLVLFTLRKSLIYIVKKNIYFKIQNNKFGEKLMKLKLFCMSILFFLFSCGGGGKSTNIPATTQPPKNSAPTISVGTSFSVFEGDPFSTDLTTVDADGDNISITISGDDAYLFELSSGQLSLISALNYETLTANGSSNVLLITLDVTDGSATTTQSIQVTVLERLLKWNTQNWNENKWN